MSERTTRQQSARRPGAMTGSEPGDAAGIEAGGLDLQRYFPYRLAILAEQVSLAVAEVYAKRFHLSRQEWRVLAVLGANDHVAATDIGRITTLDKMQVSRAMQALEARGIVRRTEAADDRRKRLVELTAAGRALYQEIVPLAVEREAAILATLSRDDVAALDRIMTKIAEGAVGSLAAPDG